MHVMRIVGASDISKYLEITTRSLPSSMTQVSTLITFLIISNDKYILPLLYMKILCGC